MEMRFPHKAARADTQMVPPSSPGQPVLEAPRLRQAEGLPADGKLICLDVSQEWFNIGKPFIEKAGVLNRIDFRVGQALDSLN